MTVASGTSSQATLGPNCASNAQTICNSVLADLALTSATNSVFSGTEGLSPCTGTLIPFRTTSSHSFTDPPDPNTIFVVEYTTRPGEMNCFRNQPAGQLRAFVCNDGCGFVEDPSGAIAGCPGTTVSGDQASSTLTGNSDGSSTLSITSTTSQGFTHQYAVTIPPSGSLGNVSVVGGSRPRIRIEASLPPGTTKEVTMTLGTANSVCVVDQSAAQFSSGGGCSGNQINFRSIADCPLFSTHSVIGDPGDNGDPVNGIHNIEICDDPLASPATVTLRGLLHTVLEMAEVSDSVCGDGYCSWDEFSETCPSDCSYIPDVCGDGYCGYNEFHETCPQDCPPYYP